MKRFILLSVSALWVGAPIVAAEAQNWPARPLQVIVPIGPGGPTDVIPRVVFEQVSPQLGQPVVIENRPGAGGTLGAAFVAKAAPDGYTMLANGSGHTIAPALHKAISRREILWRLSRSAPRRASSSCRPARRSRLSAISSRRRRQVPVGSTSPRLESGPSPISARNGSW